MGYIEEVHGAQRHISKNAANCAIARRTRRKQDCGVRGPIPFCGPRLPDLNTLGAVVAEVCYDHQAGDAVISITREPFQDGRAAFTTCQVREQCHALLCAVCISSRPRHM